MDIALVLERLGLTDQDWGPDYSNYDALKKGWRGTVAVPTLEQMTTAWGEIQAEDAARNPKEEEAKDFLGKSDVFSSMFMYFAGKLGLDMNSAKAEFKALHKGR